MASNEMVESCKKQLKRMLRKTIVIEKDYDVSSFIQYVNNPISVDYLKQNAALFVIGNAEVMRRKIKQPGVHFYHTVDPSIVNTTMVNVDGKTIIKASLDCDMEFDSIKDMLDYFNVSCLEELAINATLVNDTLFADAVNNIIEAKKKLDEVEEESNVEH